jgi:hypothetical protein
LRNIPIDRRRHAAELVREIRETNHVVALEKEHFLLSVILALALKPEDNQELVAPAVLERGGLTKRCVDVVFALVVIRLIRPLHY